MYANEVTVSNPTGLHARPAAQLAAYCRKYENEIRILSGDKSCNPKSIFSLLSCCIKAGDSVRVEVEGEDAAQVSTQITDFIAHLEG